MLRIKIEEYLITRNKNYFENAENCLPTGNNQTIGICLSAALNRLGVPIDDILEPSQVELNNYSNDALLLLATEIELLDILSATVCGDSIKVGPWSIDSKNSCTQLKRRLSNLTKQLESNYPEFSRELPTLTKQSMDLDIDAI